MYHLPITAVSLLVLLGELSASPQSPPVIAGLAHEGLSQIDRGLVLMGELGCANCHDASAHKAELRGKTAPDLARVGERVLHPYLRKFLADPRAVKPGTTMPDVMHTMSAAQRADAADSLAHFLVSLSPEQARPEASDQAALKRGYDLFHVVGCVACHRPRDERGLEKPGSDRSGVPLGSLAEKYSVSSLMGFLDAPQHVRPSGRMPRLNLSPSELHDISHYLLQSSGGGADAKRRPRFHALQVDSAKASAGKALFSKLSCVRCHSLDGVDASMKHSVPATHELGPGKACLSGTRGAWPFFELSKAQRSDLSAALAAHNDMAGGEREIRRSLASFNCVACHQRGTYGGISKSRNEFFTSADENLGEAGRLPPPLTGVGAKLQTAWLGEAIAYGQSIRGYVKTRMPGFGEAAGEHLAALLDKVDTLPVAPITPLPKNRKQAEAVRKIGHQLTGTKGMNCIACHTFGGRRPEAMAAVDLVASTGQRLKQDWFYHYMLDPVKFRSDAVMPQFFPGGTSVRPDIAGGDAKKQLTGLWHYLAEGRNTRRPDGLIRPKMEIVVGDETVMLRRSAQNTGKRGISVGYPGGVNITFDAESLALNQIWWGRFVDTSGVWLGQGSGAVRVMERQRTDLGKGPAFAELANHRAPWPTVTRRELGHEFLGYVLDSKQRPTFRYRCHGVTITDAAREIATAGSRPVLRRTIHFDTGKDGRLFFRVVRGAEIKDRGSKGVLVGKYLSLKLPPDRYYIRDGEKGQELIVEVRVLASATNQNELVIDYTYEEKGR